MIRCSKSSSSRRRARWFLANQDAGQGGVFVDFFGRPASTHKAIAFLALEYKAPIVVGCDRRLGDEFRYEVSCGEIIDPLDYADDRGRGCGASPGATRWPWSNSSEAGPGAIPLAAPPLEAPAEAEAEDNGPAKVDG